MAAVNISDLAVFETDLLLIDEGLKDDQADYPSDLADNGIEHVDIDLVLKHIQHNYRTVTLGSLGKEFYASTPYLSKMIRKRTGRCFVEIVRTIRMEQAAEILLNTSLKVRDIAETVGYDSVDHFSRTFRKVYGLTPESIRNDQDLL